jgi:PAS domain S-box-containing protein
MDDMTAHDDALRAAQARIETLEAALATSQANEQRLERLVALAQEGIGIHRDGILTDCNAFLAALVGYSRDELIGQPIWRFIPEAWHDQVRTMAEVGYEGRYEFELLRKDGSAFPVEVFASNLPDSDGNCRVFVLHDLTQHQQIEASLRRSEALYRMLADNASDVIWTLDLDGHFTYVSPSVERLRGFTAEEVMAQTLEEALTPASLKLVSERLRTVIESVSSGSREPLQSRLELEQPCKNGSTVWTEAIASVLYDEDGGFIGILGATRDISEQRQMREALARERNLLRTLLDNLPASVYVKDRDGRFLLNNTESLRRMGLTSQAETLGKVTADFYPEVAARWDAVEREVIATSQAQVHEDEMVWRSGETRWVQASYLPLQNEQGQIIGILGLNQDVTARREAARRALDLEMERERSQVLERFLGDASHDLKTPLTTMRVSLAVLKRDPTPELRAQHLNILDAQVAHLQGLLDDLLNLTRMDRHLELSLRRYDLNLLVRDVLAEARPLIEQQDHSLTLDLGQEEPRFPFDYEQISRALAALLTNAINYTPPGGRLTVRTGQEGDQAVIVVADNGIGIASGDQPYVFERFFRADRARSARSGGMGLGLAIARKIVEAHGGRINFRSVLDSGSTFTIRLPLDGPTTGADADTL